MTVSEMHYALEQGVNRIASHVFDDIQPDERDFYLNMGVEIFVKSRLWDKQDTQRAGFSGSQKRLDDLREIVEYDYQDVIATPDINLDYAFFDLPKDYWFKVNLRFLLLTDTCNVATLASPQRECEGRIVSQDEVYTILKDPHSRTTWKSPVGIIVSDQVKGFRDKKFILKGVMMDYIRKPALISLSSNQDCELADHTHQEIVDIAVTRILEVTENPRLQNHSQLVSNSN